jgi:hypothetical protein
VNDEQRSRRKRGAMVGLLLGLLLALGGVGYAVTSSPSASTGPGKEKPSGTPTAEVLAPNAPSNLSASSSAGTSGSSSGSNTGSTQVVLAPAASSGTGGNGNCVEPSNGNGNCVKSFGVTVGQVQTLYPGLLRTLPVTYSNPNSFDILVTTYRVSVSVPSSQASACPASSLQVPSGTVTLAPQTTVPKNGAVSTTVPIKLAPTAPDGCQSVTFTITVNATAVKK